MTESRNNSLLGNGIKKVSAEMYMHATIQEQCFLCGPRSCKHASSTREMLCFLCSPCRGFILKTTGATVSRGRSVEELIEYLSYLRKN
jgi:hypothetical protein